MRFIRTCACSLVLAIAACAPAGDKSDAAQTSSDSLVLERTACFGSCPVYRLRITNAEAVRFESRNRGDSASVAIDTARAGTFASLISKARAAGFYELPPEIRRDTLLCHNFATDHPTVITTIFSGQSSKHVSDYQGCFESVDRGVLPPVQKLRAFESDIDSTLQASRWAKPNKPAK